MEAFFGLCLFGFHAGAYIFLLTNPICPHEPGYMPYTIAGFCLLTNAMPLENLSRQFSYAHNVTYMCLRPLSIYRIILYKAVCCLEATMFLDIFAMCSCARAHLRFKFYCTEYALYEYSSFRMHSIIPLSYSLT